MFVRNRLVDLGAILLAGSLTLFGADFWQTKKYSDWSDKEVGKMLLDSPWARKASVELRGSAVMDVPNPGGLTDIGGDMNSRRGDLDDAGQGPSRREQTGGRPPEASSAQDKNVVVRWQSALPVKQAIARFHYGDFTEPSWNIDKMLYLDEPYYIAGIIGLPERLAGPNLKALTSVATLRLKNRPAIQAVAIQTEELMAGTVNLFFFFPKLQPGAHLITDADKEVEVVLNAPGAEVRRKFKLKDLMYNGKLEL